MLGGVRDQFAPPFTNEATGGATARAGAGNREVILREKLRVEPKRWEEEQRRGKETPASDECDEPLDEDLEPPSDWFDPRRWEGE
jgi:hypothetical protein